MAKKLISLFLVGAIILSQTGCSTLRSGTQRLNVVVSEPDAKIFVNGEYAGKGKITTRVPRNENVSIMARKDGYLPAIRNIGTKMSFTGILDIIGGCIILVPLFGLLFPGAHELEQNNVSMILEKENSNLAGEY